MAGHIVGQLCQSGEHGGADLLGRDGRPAVRAGDERQAASGVTYDVDSLE